MSESRDPWDEAGERWSAVLAKLRERYREAAGERGPSEEEVAAAVHTLGDAARTVLDSLSSAAADPEMREQLRSAGASIVHALGEGIKAIREERGHLAEESPG